MAQVRRHRKQIEEIMKSTAKNKFVSGLKKYVIGPVMVAVGAAVATVSASGADIDPKAAGLAFLGALLGAILHKEVIVRFTGEE